MNYKKIIIGFVLMLCLCTFIFGDVKAFNGSLETEIGVLNGVNFLHTDNNYLYVSEYDDLKIYNTTDFSEVTTINNIGNDIRGGCNNDNILIVLGQDNKINIINKSDWSIIQTKTEPTDVTKDCVFNDNKFFVSSNDGNIYSYYLNNYSFDYKYETGSSSDVSKITIDDNYLYSDGTSLYRLYYWNLTDKSRDYKSISDAINDLEVNNNYLYVWAGDELYKYENLNLVNSKIIDNTNGRGLSIDNKYIYLGGLNNSGTTTERIVFVLNKSFNLITQLKEAGDTIFSVDNDDKYVYASGKDDYVQVYNKYGKPVINYEYDNVSLQNRIYNFSVNTTSELNDTVNGEVYINNVMYSEFVNNINFEYQFNSYETIYNITVYADDNIYSGSETYNITTTENNLPKFNFLNLKNNTTYNNLNFTFEFEVYDDADNDVTGKVYYCNNTLIPDDNIYMNYDIMYCVYGVANDTYDTNRTSNITFYSRENYDPYVENIAPENNAIDTDLRVTVKYKMFDDDNDTIKSNVFNCDTNELLYNSSFVNSGSNISFDYTGLTYGRNYCYYYMLTDSYNNTYVSDDYSFTTKTQNYNIGLTNDIKQIAISFFMIVMYVLAIGFLLYRKDVVSGLIVFILSVVNIFSFNWLSSVFSIIFTVLSLYWLVVIFNIYKSVNADRDN